MFQIRAPGHVPRMADKTRDVSGSPAKTTARALTAILDVLMTCEIADGTPLIIRPDAGSPTPSANASRLLTTSTHPPQTSGAKISKTDTSKLSEVEASTRDSSPGPNSAIAQDIRPTTPRCSITTPLGRPVDPEV